MKHHEVGPVFINVPLKYNLFPDIMLLYFRPDLPDWKSI